MTRKLVGLAHATGSLLSATRLRQGEEDMLEIRIHGRGGQGSVVASEILASAFFRTGLQVQAFPTFGVERRGAPVAAFLRVSDRAIRIRCRIEEPNHVIVLDPTLLAAVDVTAGLKAGAWIVLNSEKAPEFYGRFLSRGWAVAVVDASSIAMELGLGSRTNPIVNTAMMGAFAAATGLLPLAPILACIREQAPVRAEANLSAAQSAFDQVRAMRCEEMVR